LRRARAMTSRRNSRGYALGICCLLPVRVILTDQESTKPGAVPIAIVGPLAGVLLGATFLAGPLSEKTYVPLLMAPALTCLLVRRNAVTGLVIAAGLIAAYNSKLALGLGYNGTAWQLQFVSVEVLVFAACVLALLTAVRSGLVDGSSDRTWRSLAGAALGRSDARNNPQATPVPRPS
jgi:hypothetical protein